jgi:hypothetical protein
MRHATETAPRDGEVVILQDDASGTYDVAHWSAEAGEWVGENGEASKIAPIHWHPMPSAKFLLQEDEGSSNPSPVRPSAWWRDYNFIVDVVSAAALIGLFFYVIQDARQQDIVRIRTIDEQVVAQGTQLPSQNSKTALPASRQTEANQASAPEKAQQAQQVAVVAVPEAQQSLTEERAQALAQELTEGLDVQLRAEAAKSAQSLGQERQKTAALAQEAAAAQQELTTSTAKHRQALDEERARSAALASELATAQREIETQAAQLRKASEETGQLKQAEAAKSAQLLEQERDRTAALAQEAAAARQELTTSTAKHRQALDEERARRAALWSELATAQREIETQAAQSRKAGYEAGQLKQAAEGAMAELRQPLQQERDRTEAMARDLEAVRRTIDTRDTLERAVNSQIAQVTQAVEAADSEQAAAAVSQDPPEVARLMGRARALLGQGNISAARIVLARAAETGSALASFTLAETYDPVILSTWGTYGTRGDATKARELYAKAHAGGIQEAKDRLSALDQ